MAGRPSAQAVYRLALRKIKLLEDRSAQEYYRSWAKQNFLAFQAEDGERTGELIAHARTQVEYLCGKYGLPNEEHTSGFWEGAGR
eukprot:PRCOL_00002317-RA